MWKNFRFVVCWWLFVGGCLLVVGGWWLGRDSLVVGGWVGILWWLSIFNSKNEYSDCHSYEVQKNLSFPRRRESRKPL